MLRKERYPILEFDANSPAKIEPKRHIRRQAVPSTCVITYFGDIVEEKAKTDSLQEIAQFRTSFVTLPIYKVIVRQRPVGLVTGFWGAPGSARQLKDLITMGFEKFIVCGGAGVLQRDLQVGRLVFPMRRRCSRYPDSGMSLWLRYSMAATI